VQGLPRSSNSDVEAAAKACATRPVNITNVVIKNRFDRMAEFECSNWPRIFNPTLVRRR
jgi:hypothetical protein